MLLPDVNVFVYAHREEFEEVHHAHAAWLVRLATGPEPFAVSVLAMAGFARIVTNPRIFSRPSTHDDLFGFLGELTKRQNARIVCPGAAFPSIFERLCRESGASGKLVADAAHAAVAIEHGCTFVTTDADFDRFPGLRWRHPLRPIG